MNIAQDEQCSMLFRSDWVLSKAQNALNQVRPSKIKNKKYFLFFNCCCVLKKQKNYSPCRMYFIRDGNVDNLMDQ
jgi:hypothetical protein